MFICRHHFVAVPVVGSTHFHWNGHIENVPVDGVNYRPHFRYFVMLMYSCSSGPNVIDLVYVTVYRRRGVIIILCWFTIIITQTTLILLFLDNPKRKANWLKVSPVTAVTVLKEWKSALLFDVFGIWLIKLIKIRAKLNELWPQINRKVRKFEYNW